MFSKLDRSSKVVIITGAGSGLGKCTAEHLASKGDCVIALDVNISSLTPTDNLIPFEMDVSDYQNCCSVLEKVKDEFKSKGGEGDNGEEKGEMRGDRFVDAIINFAGIFVGGPLLEMRPEAFERLFMVNVVGTFNVNRCFHELVKPKGKIVNIASEVSYGNIGAPFAIYSASKAAVDNYSSALRTEMIISFDEKSKDFLYVVTVNPGPFNTNMTSGNDFMLKHLEKNPDTKYKDILVKGQKITHDYEQAYMNEPIKLAKKMFEIVHTRKPKARYLVGVSSQMKLARHIPEWIRDWAFKSQVDSMK